MKRMALIFGALALFAQTTPAATKADSILAVTDGARARLAWVRWQWADSNYNYIPPYIDLGQIYENNHQTTQLMGFDTDKAKEFYIDSTIGYHCFPKVTRKNGNYVIWNDPGNNCSWIRDIACTTPKRKLIDGGDFWVVACQYNPVTDSEYVYIFLGWNTTSNYFKVLAGKGVAQVPLTADYTADLTKKRTIITTANPDAVMHTVNLSQDGKYMGCNVPLPNTIMLETATGTQISRRDPQCEYGCHTNIAPDNSYRFFHLTDAHVEIAMFAAGTAASVSMWRVNIMSAMPGNSGANNAMDPRWTNDVRYFTNSYPLETGIRAPDMTPDQLRAADASRAGSFCLGKFNAGFTAVERAVRVTDGDVRHREGVGDAWISPAGSARAGQDDRAQDRQRPRLGINGLRFTSPLAATLEIGDMSGRIVRASTVKAGEVVDLRDLRQGSYVVTLRNPPEVRTTTVVVQR